MKNKVIITGAAGFLGSTTAGILQEKGFQVLGTVQNESQSKRLSDMGVESVTADLTSEDEVRKMIIQTEAPDTIKAAVLIAGGFSLGDLGEMTAGDLDRMIRINFLTAFNVCKELFPVFQKNGGGQFILIGARPALDGSAGSHMAAYAFSKGLVFQLSDMINAWGKKKNINSTVLVPSIIDTRANREAMPDADFSAWTTTEAIGETIAFLLSDSGKHVRESIIKLYNQS